MNNELVYALEKAWIDQHPYKPFVPGQTYIPSTAKVIDFSEALAAILTIMDGHWTDGPLVERFEQELAKATGREEAVFTNSGSSALEIAFEALFDDIEPGEIITCAVGFPTTVAPIVRNGFVPVFIDVYQDYYNPIGSMIEEAINQNTRGVILASTLGNPIQLDSIWKLCRDNNLRFIHDACDAQLSRWMNKPATAYGDLSTLSFYPAHHMTTGEGGAVLGDKRYRRRLERSEKWGKHCWCKSGEDNACNKRFDYGLSDSTPWDHKYFYTTAGHRMAGMDITASIGLVQLSRLETFRKLRERNFQALKDGLADLTWLSPGKSFVPAEPSWFGFPMRLAPDIDKNMFTNYLEANGIGTRPVFGGNLIRQPMFSSGRYQFSQIGSLSGADEVAHHCLWIGCHPGITPEMTDYMIKVIKEY